MEFSALKHKIQFLTNSITPSVRDELEFHFKERIQNLKESQNMSASLRSLLFVELNYALLKNRAWLKTEVFWDLLKEYLHDNYPLGKKSLGILMDLQKVKIQDIDHLPVYDHTLSNIDYLEFRFVKTISRKLEKQKDLGIGNMGFILVKNAKDQFSSKFSENEEKGSTDHLICDLKKVILKHHCDARRAPWSIGLSQLKWKMLYIREPFFTICQKIGVRWIFDSLLMLGVEKDCKDNKFIGALEKTLKENKVSFQHDQLKLLVDYLHESDLIYFVSSSSNKKYKTCHLSKTSYELTSEAFVQSIESDHTISRDFILSLSPTWQKKLIESVTTDQCSNVLLDMIKNRDLIHPTSISSVASKLKSLNTPQEIAGLMSQYLAFGISSEYRIEASQVLFELPQTSVLKRLLIKHAKYDQSMKVRDFITKKIIESRLFIGNEKEKANLLESLPRKVLIR